MLLLSPHPDDIAWSLGGTLAQLRTGGAGVHTLTFFTRTRYAPGHWVADVERVSAARAREERAWAAATGVTLLRGELDDASLRGFDDDSELGATPEPEIVQAAGRLLHDAVVALEPDAIYVPGSCGGHVDHTAVRLAADDQPFDVPLLYYEDLPYAATSRAASGRHRLVVGIDDHWPAKEAGMRHFASQSWQDVLPLVRAHAEQVGGEPVSTDSRSGADLVRHLTRTVVQ